MMSYKLVYSEVSRDQVRSLNPKIKPIVKRRLQELKDDPFTGKSLEKKLSGYRSLVAKRFRIIYKILQNENIVQIHYVGHRKDIYEILKEVILKTE